MLKSTKRLLLAGASALAILTSVGAADADTYSVPGSYDFVVPTSGEYDIVALGASGGNSENFVGGLGAGVAGLTYLTSGEELYLIVGGAGAYSAGGAGGGGGGSFILTSTSVLAAAGGGGGAGLEAGKGGNGQITTSGRNGGGVNYGGLGGQNGNGGGGGTYGRFLPEGYNGGGGTGAKTAGGNGLGSESGYGGLFDFGGIGYAGGGYGGGGGSGKAGGGGGGGFSGGGGSSTEMNGSGKYGYGGGGGGSYLSRYVFDQEEVAGLNYGDGFISISLTGDPPTPIPEPSTWAMMLAGFAGLGWLARLRRRRLAPS